LGFFLEVEMMKFEIRRAKNGWIIKSEDPEEFNPEIVGVEEPDEHEGFRTLLWELLEHYGPSRSRYDYKRIHVALIPGDKYEGPIDEKYREDLTNLRDRIDYCLKQDTETETE
jgi:hypothetical protein